MRFGGAAWLGFAVLTWFSRNAEASPGRRAIVLSLVAFFAASSILAVLSALSEIGPALTAWPFAGVYLLFALAFAYLGLVRPSDS